jgi:eukaryotic-like serine/threonine-protein kinase
MIGTRLTHFEIKAHLGSGGMGEVYQATDTKLSRDVAIKLLPENFSADAERIARFQREARVLASLSQPNIAAIYGLEESGARSFLVMELVHGETLAERIRRGPVPVGESLGYALQILEALEYAHDKNIVHRDLKPANVKITPEGKVVVLDFGLAKAYEPEARDSNLTNSPTLSMAATQAGVILGTAAYMSPEQARGRQVDRRTDIFSFGCVLYEMLAGRAAFEGEDVADILGSVLKTEPDWTRLPQDVPPSIRKLLHLCLQKNPRKRRQNAGDVRIDIEEALAEPEIPSAAVAAIPAVARHRGRLGWIAAGLFALVAALSLFAALRPTPAPRELRVDINTPPSPVPLEFALSPDGHYVVFVGDAQQRLWLRALDKSDAQPLAGTEGADYPFWSADSRSIGFFASGKLYRIDVSGGKPQPLTNAQAGRGGTWNANGTIVFASGLNSALWRIPASGGEPVPASRIDPPRQTVHRFPHFLPDGQHFIFYAVGIPEASGIYLGSLDGVEPKRLTAADTAGVYLHPNLLVFARQEALVARRLDIAKAELTGDPIPLADPIGYDGNLNFGAFSVSADGSVAYRSAGAARRQLIWFDRAGKKLGVAGEPDSVSMNAPELSPDEHRTAIDRTMQGNRDVWLMDLVRGNLTRLTFDPATDGFPIWSPDGTRIAFESRRKGSYDLWLKASSGGGTEELLMETPNNEWPFDWSRDGRYLLYYKDDPKTGSDLWALPMSNAQQQTAGDRKPIVIANTPFDESRGQFSPDGRWVAYETNESGRFEIVVQRFPNPNGKWQVSTMGGIQPRWRADGKELFFIALDRRMMAVTVNARPALAQGEKDGFDAGSPVALFPTSIYAGTANPVGKAQYAVSRDGRFLINTVLDDAAAPITLLMNWKPPK